MYWDKVLREVLNKHIAVQEYKVTNVATLYSNKMQQSLKKTLYQTGKKNYCLGPKYNGAYFTKREAECMMMLIKGKTINKAAIALRLSPRTVEFYLKNMKAKVRCRTKHELIEKVLESSFLQNLDFI
jgi:DNA-binding CsgD family transcriptional regulator